MLFKVAILFSLSKLSDLKKLLTKKINNPAEYRFKSESSASP